MVTLYSEQKLEILDSYIQFVESELAKPVENRIGTIDKEHLKIVRRLKSDFKNKLSSEQQHKYDKSGTSVYLNHYPMPISVQFELTSRCNQACIQCYNQSGMDKNRKNEDIPIEKWIETAKELARIPIPQVIISGGEPTLLGEDLFKIMDIFHEIGTHFIFITNGMNINESNIDRFAKYNYAWMQFSIDGATEEVHDHVRGAKGSFKKVVRAASLARSRGIPVGIASTIIRHNLHEINELIDLAYNLGAFKITLGEFMYAGRAVKNKESIALDDKDISQIRRVILKKSIQYANLLKVIKPTDPALSLRYKMCSISTGVLIRPNGEVRIDCQAPARIGNIMDSSIIDIWKKIGYKGWSQPSLLDYISKIYTYMDLHNTYPRTHVDPDIDLSIYSEVL